MNIPSYKPAAAIQPDPATVAQWLGGELREGEKAPARLTGLATLAEAASEEISFVASEKASSEARASRSGLLIVAEGWDTPGRARVVVAQVWAAVAVLMEKLYPRPRPVAGVHPTAVLGEGVALGEGVSVGPYCVIGDGCRLGDGVVLGPQCILGDGCEVGAGTRLVARVTCVGKVLIGERVIIHPGAVLGADGFKFEPVGGRILKIPQVGAVVIEDDVEIGACATVDRAFLYETRVGRGSKIDNQVQIAHNVQVGPSCIMAAHVGIAGSTKLGAGCMLGGKAGLADGLTIGNQVMIGAYAGVHSDWPDGSQIIGAPAMPMKPFWRLQATIQRLPEMARRLRALEQRVEEAAPKNED